MKISIRRNSVCRNPNAGNREYKVYGPAVWTAEFETAQPIKGDEKFGLGDAAILASSMPTGRGARVVLQIYNIEDREKIIEHLKKWGIAESSLTIGGGRSIQRLYSIHPEPNFTFEYEDPDVICDGCGAVFPVSKLESDCMGMVDEDAYSNAVCPKCRMWDCCDLEFERLSDEEMGKIADSN